MIDPTPVPKHPNQPSHATTVGGSEVLSLRSQGALVSLLLVLVGFVVWRWCSDHYSARPTEVHRAITHRIDINRASRTELQQLPHVGPQLAEKIVSHRQTNGQFKHIDELRNVHGIGDATLNKLRPWLTVDDPNDDEGVMIEADRLVRSTKSKANNLPKNPTTTNKIVNINRATLAELETLPNIGPVLAQRMIDERTKKPFANAADLRRVSGIGPKRLEVLKDWVTVTD